MKKQNLIAEANCGLTIELTIIDQYKLTDELAIIDTHKAEREAYEAWEHQKDEAQKSVKTWEEREECRKAFVEANPKPVYTISGDRLNQAYENIYKFVKKFALEGERISNIFDDEK